MKQQNNLMMFCIKQAEKAALCGEIPVAAVVFDHETQKIISYAHNQTENGFDATAHAEVIAIRKACKKLKRQRLEGLDIYVTLEPCPMCAAAISLARFRRLYFGAYDPKGGGVEHGCRIFESSSCNHKPEIYGGMEEKKCSELLKNFFHSLRK